MPKVPDNNNDWFDRMRSKYPVQLKLLFYVETGVGWQGLLEYLFEEIHRRESVIKTDGREVLEEVNLDSYNDNYGSEYDPYYLVQFNQIKEKYGSLRLYHDGGNDEGIRLLVSQAEKSSLSTCEVCSGQIDISKPRQLRRWVHTLCESCLQDWEKDQKNHY